MDPAEHEFSFDYTLREMFPDARHVDEFRTYLEPVEIPAGEVVAGGAGAGHLDFVETGRLAVISSFDNTTRIRRGGPGSILGIASFFKHGGPASLVTLRAETDCRIHRLTEEAYFRLVAEHPAVAAALQRHALVTISDRFADLVTSFELAIRGKA